MIAGKFVVYTLIDPRDGQVRYVGRTADLARRLADYQGLNAHGNGELSDWLYDLRDMGKQVSHAIVHWCENERAAELFEAAHIQKLQFAGMRLLNRADGGKSRTHTPARHLSEEDWRELAQRFNLVRELIMELSYNVKLIQGKTKKAGSLLDNAADQVWKGKMDLENYAVGLNMAHGDQFYKAFSGVRTLIPALVGIRDDGTPIGSEPSGAFAQAQGTPKH
jgi:hypothetical protein